MLLLVASLQWQVFVGENTASMRLQVGDNMEISYELRPADLAQLSPVLNFIFCWWELGAWWVGSLHSCPASCAQEFLTLERKLL